MYLKTVYFPHQEVIEVENRRIIVSIRLYSIGEYTAYTLAPVYWFSVYPIQLLELRAYSMYNIKMNQRQK